MSLALERTLAPASGYPAAPAADEPAPRLNIVVVFTSAAATIAALKKAGELADRLSARVSLVIPQIVPYPLPLASPPVLLDFSERRFGTIASECPVETRVRLYLCRDRVQMLEMVLARRSLVVLGGRKRWWPTAEKTLARKLRRSGHEVVYTETE